MKFYKKIVLFFLIFASFQVCAQNTLDNLGLTSSTPASVAYSLRKLSSSYVSYAIQVRRSSDNATQDIGFTSGGDLDTSALLAFVGANNGYVSIWYDQSGNGRNLTQTNVSRQPSIVSNGVVYTRNSVPTIFHDNVDDGILYSGSNYLTTNPLSVNIVASSNSNNSGARRAVQGTNNWLIGPYSNKHSWYAGGWNHQINDAWSLTSLEIFTVIQPISNSNTSFRNSESLTTLNNRGVPNKIQTGVEGTYSEPLDGFLSEILVFSSEISTTNRNIFEKNQGLYYGICLLASQPSSNNQSVILGGTPVGLSVLSSDPTATYQWYSNNVNSNSGGTLLSGETNGNYTPSTSVEGTLYYYAVVTNATETCSSKVSGSVRVGIEITTQPSNSNQTVIQNNPVNSLNVVATGSSITYQWYKNGTKSNTGGTLISGATTNSYTPPSTALGTTYYYVVVSGNNTVLVTNPSGAIKITTTPVIWNGPTITFQKVDYANYNQVQNQDVITNLVKITRANSQGLFNIATESSFGGSSPSDTEWALGTLSNYANLTYRNWQQAVSYSPPTSVNKTYVVHLISENIYLELKVLSWTDMSNGGGFSYSRSTCSPPSEPTASNQSFNSSATVADLVATGTSIKWYAGSTGGSSLPTSTNLASGTYYVTQTVNSCESARKPITVTIISCSAPTLSNFNNSTKTYFDVNYTITPPSTNSAGLFTYTSSNLSVATVSGTTVTIVGLGSTTITATQDADGSYCSGSVASTLIVNNVSVVTKNGQVSTTDFNFINKNGALGGVFGVNKNGMSIQTKTYDIVTAGLVMHLDASNSASYLGTGTTWSDLSGFGNNGTIKNGVTFNSANNGSMVFDGVNDYFVTDSNFNLSDTDKLTIQIILKTASAATAMVLEHSVNWNSNNAFGILSTNNKMQITDHNQNYNVYNSVAAINDNNWHLLSTTMDRSLGANDQSLIYIDGNAPNKVNVSGYNSDNNGNFTSSKLYISSRAGTGYFFNGNIAQVLIYKRVLTAEEIQQNFNALKLKYGL